MKKNNSLREICDGLMAADSVLIFPHNSIDGDSLGSSVALCRALLAKGKTASVLIEEEIPGFLKFLDDGSCTFERDIIKSPGLCVCIDCAGVERFALRKDKFLEGAVTMCIDHHITSEPFADLNFIDSGAAAAAEIIYEILCETGSPIDKVTGEALYAAVITDTGNFQYSNTTVNSHLITAGLFSLGIDHTYVSSKLYQDNRAEKFLIAGKIYATIRMIAGGKAVIAHVTREMLQKSGASMEDSEGIAEHLRTISGVNISIFAKEMKSGEIKFSMRSKRGADVSAIAMKYGGGGHASAAGCTIKKPVKEAIMMIESDVEKYFAGQFQAK